MMNEELKKYVNDYMDGEKVEYTSAGILGWEIVDSFEDFDCDGEDVKTYRIKPKADNKWQRVIDEGYLCKFWDNECPECADIGFLEVLNSDYKRVNGYYYDNCEVLREKGIKQPYFQGDKIPEIDGQIVVYFKSGVVDMMYADVLAWDWSEVVAYIEV